MSALALRPHDRRALILGTLLLVVLLGFARIVRPAMASLAQDRRALSEQQELLARERALLAVAPKLPQAQRTVNQVLAGASARLFAGDSVAATAELTSFVTDVATATGVRVSMVEGRPPRTTSGVSQLSVDVRGEGTWRQVLTFIRAVESSGHLVDASTVRIERGMRGGPLGGSLVSLSATLTGYGRALP